MVSDASPSSVEGETARETVRYRQEAVDAVQDLVEDGQWPSRSEVFRAAADLLLLFDDERDDTVSVAISTLPTATVDQDAATTQPSQVHSVYHEVVDNSGKQKPVCGYAGLGYLEVPRAVAERLLDLDQCSRCQNIAENLGSETGPLRSDGGSKYVNPTGDGYLGTYSISNREVIFNLRTKGPWGEDIAEVHALEEPNESVALVRDADASDPRLMGSHEVWEDGRIGVGGQALDHLGVAGDDEVRLYERAAGGLRLVPADDDPMLLTDGGPEQEAADQDAAGNPATAPDESLADCNCVHLPSGAMCAACSPHVPTDGGDET